VNASCQNSKHIGYFCLGRYWRYFHCKDACLLQLPCLQNEAFALSASALSGKENYVFNGNVSVINPAGFLGSRTAYEGKVQAHGNMRIQWKDMNANAASVKTPSNTTYQPLQLLEAFKGKSAVVTYAETPTPNKPVHFQIKLDDKIARDRVISALRADFALLSNESVLRSHPVEANQIISASKKRFEAALTTLKVSTVCNWTAEPKDWFPTQMSEETVLDYKWNGLPCREKRISQTNFLHNAPGGTMKKVSK
jgi:hypothetical protein